MFTTATQVMDVWSGQRTGMVMHCYFFHSFVYVVSLN